MSGCGSGSVFAAALQLVCTLPAFRVVILFSGGLLPGDI